MPVDYNKIPLEMRQYRQWICWRYEDRNGPKPTKIPYNPLAGKMASVTDASTWCSFDDAVRCISLGYDGIGFVLTKNDPYTFIDLDDTEGNADNLQRQVKIYSEFDSYSEKSPSGKGLHIIVKGHIPNGRRRSAVELYSSERYMTMTGDIFDGKDTIYERQALTQMLWAQMGGGAAISIYEGDSVQHYTDEQVIERALGAVNGDKFKLLLDGTWHGIYPSQSEADFAFIDIIAFYTQNGPQIERLFRASPLGQREKAQRGDYVKKMILRSFDRMLPPIDLTGLQNAVDDNKEIIKAVADGKSSDISGGTHATTGVAAEIRKFFDPKPITPPPGLLGDIAQFIYQSSPRPVAETAIAAAIGLMAGITGSTYNISNTGLNMYICLLAPTGTGKEALQGGVSRLLNATATQCPAILDFRGPAEIASGQALLKHISNPTKRCFVSVVGEFGLKMQQLSNPRASSSEIMLKKVLLDLYNKSGHKDVVAPSIYAEKDKNTPAVQSPAVTIVGESTPETFYESLDEKLIADGLLPRFMFIEYTGERPARNKFHGLVEPSLQLVTQLGDIATHCLIGMSTHNVKHVGMTPEAEAFLDEMDTLVDKMINSTKTDALRHLWNRAHIKTLKLAALVAIGVHYIEPVITLEHAQWAYNLVVMDILSIANRFSRGEIGKNTDENKQGNAVLRACAEYLSADFRSIKSYGVDACLHEAKIIPYSFLSRKVRTTSIFMNDKKGATDALKRTVHGLLDAGDLKEIGKHEMHKKYTYSGRAFMLASPEKLPAIIK